jgi:hypothetical protein
MVDLTLPDAVPAQDTADAAERRLVARVLAWQHRHPLARRLGAGDVGGLGVIALPYGAGAGQRATPLYHQPNLLTGLSHRALVGFAARHAVGERPGPAGWPRRDIERADAASEPAPQLRFLLTAVIADPRSALPRRLLLAPAGTAVWGRRPLDRVRTGVAGALTVAVLVLAAWALARGWGGAAAPLQAPPGAVPVQPVPAASSLHLEPAASSVAAAAGGQGMSAAPADAPPSQLRPASGAVPASAPVPGRVAATTPTPASTPTAASPSGPNRASAPVIAAASSVAVAQLSAGSSPAQAATLAVPASVAPPRLLPMPGRPAAAAAVAPSVPAPPAASAPPAPAGLHFALVSLPSKKRADAEATMNRVRDVLGPAIGNMQVQVMSSPEGFVVTLWPLPTQADAERMAEVLARRGAPMKWLEF